MTASRTAAAGSRWPPLSHSVDSAPRRRPWRSRRGRRRRSVGRGKAAGAGRPHGERRARHAKGWLHAPGRAAGARTAGNAPVPSHSNVMPTHGTARRHVGSSLARSPSSNSRHVAAPRSANGSSSAGSSSRRRPACRLDSRPLRRRLQRPHCALARRRAYWPFQRTAAARMAGRADQGWCQSRHDPQGADAALKRASLRRRERRDHRQPAIRSSRPSSAPRDAVQPLSPATVERLRAAMLNPAPREVAPSGAGRRTRRRYHLPPPGTPRTWRRDALIVSILAYAGLRPGELRALPLW